MQLSLKEVVRTSSNYLRIIVNIRRDTHNQSVSLTKTARGWAFSTNENTNQAATITLETVNNIQDFMSKLDLGPLDQLDFKERDYPES